jgi:hypothetical protein
LGPLLRGPAAAADTVPARPEVLLAAWSLCKERGARVVPLLARLAVDLQGGRCLCENSGAGCL